MRYLILVLFLIGGLSLQAQQDARYSQYMFNGLVLNPAYAGSNDYVNLSAFYRNQWVDIPGAPTTASISAHAPVGQKKKVGLGAFLESDEVGVNSVIDFFTSYSYKLRLNQGTLVGGIQLGFIRIQSNLAEINTVDEVYDAAFVGLTETKPNFGLGLYYYSEKFYAGFSVPHMINYTSDLTSTFNRYEINMFATAGAAFRISETTVFKPSMLFRYQPTGSFFVAETETNTGSQFQADLSAAIWYLDSLWFGASYRTDEGLVDPESLVALFSYHFPSGLKFGYAYDININDINTYNNGSHEIMFGFTKNLHKSDTMMSPRYF